MKPSIQYKIVWEDWKRRYVLTQDAELTVSQQCPCNYLGTNICLEKLTDPEQGTRISVRAGYSWDGDTCAPDYPTTIIGSLVHDAGIDEIENIMSVWRLSYYEVRVWLDDAFDDINDQCETPWLIARLYYRCVRIFGQIKSWFYRKTVALAKSIYHAMRSVNGG